MSTIEMQDYAPEPFATSFIYLPENEFAIPTGYYGKTGFVQLMRTHKGAPDIIQFLADMLE